MKAATLHRAVASVAPLTAAELMTAPVMTIPEDTSLCEAARLLHRANVSGAPVVDAEGRCIGIISSSDFVNWASTGPIAPETTQGVSFLAPWGELIDIEEAHSDPIRRFMTALPVTTAPTTPIGEVAQKMVDHHIHRLLVVDDRRTPMGIITSTDIMAAVGRGSSSHSRMM